MSQPGDPWPAGGPPLTIRAIRAGDDLDAELDLRHRAFGPMTGGDRDWWLAELRMCIADSRLYGAWDGSQLVGTARYYDLRQWWHGRSLPMAGVAGVKVAPEIRGRGVGKALMTALLGAMAEREYPISVLYPATTRLYRSLGWEVAGGRYLAKVPGRSLGSLLPLDPLVAALHLADASPASPGQAEPPLALRRASAADADEVVAVLGAVYAGTGDCGPSTFDPASVGRWLAGPDVFAYLAADGFLAYSWDGSDRDIMVHVLQAVSRRTARTLWGVVSSHASVTETVRICLGPDDPITWLTREPDVSVCRDETWMLRVLNPRAAIAARGFPAAAQLSVPLRLADPDLPANAGPHILSVRAGQGSLTRGEMGRPPGSPSAPPVAFGPRGFAALFAGVPMATLRRAGLAAGGDHGTDASLDSAFAARPYLLDSF